MDAKAVCIAGFSEIIGCFLALHFTLKHNKWKWQYAGTFNILAGMLGCLGWLFTGADESEYQLQLHYRTPNFLFLFQCLRT